MVKRINLALQGGGAHGAFTWGALDRLLEEEEFEIAAISGTSAGALNAAALKAGLVGGGREGAKEQLDWIWRRVGAITDPHISDWFAPFSGASDAFAHGLAYNPAFVWMDAAMRMVSPYSFGGLIKNPVERVISDINFDDVTTKEGPRIFISTTNVRSGKIRVFADEEVVSKTILASACLPNLFEAVELYDPKTGKEEAFWDGGYVGNPALFPMFEADLPDDIMIVSINPQYRDEVPRDTQAIQNRINEISFNSSLLRELRAISFVKRLIADGRVESGQMKDLNLHMIKDDDLMTELSVATKLVALPLVLTRLKEAGRKSMDNFLAEHRDDIGKRGTMNLEAMFA